MAARIVWWVLTLGMLAVFHLSVTKEQVHCRFSNWCLYCKYPYATKDHCLEHRICFIRIPFVFPVCIKYEREEEKRSCAIPPPENYIVGGSPTNEGNWPWQVSLQSSTLVHACGGVLIDKDWVLTAAHCVDESRRPNVKDTIVVLGEFDLKRRSGKEQFQRIKHIFVHPKFQLEGYYPNDVALIQLEYDAHYNEYVSPICLPSFNDVYASNSCFVTGWGVTLGDRSRLRVAQVTMLAPDVCKYLGLGNIRPKYHICGNYSLKGACFRDSGGPLSCVRSSDGRFVVAGVALWSHPPCSKLHYTSIYTNIQTYVPWINNIMNSTKESS